MIKYISIDKPPEIPPSVAVCPVCGAELEIREINEWHPDTGQVTEEGLLIACVTEPDTDDPGYLEWNASHYRYPYMEWLPVDRQVYQWFNANYRLGRPDEEKLARWQAAVKEWKAQITKDIKAHNPKKG